jgi:hypothetical protein
MEAHSANRGGILRRHPLIFGLATLAVIGAIFVGLHFEPQALLFDDRVSEAAPAATGVAAPRVVAQGDFRGLAHGASGTAQVLGKAGKRFLRFEDLDVSNGPDLKVYLSAAPSASSADSFDDDYVSLGDLKGNIGDQNYELGREIDLSRFRSAVVWCERFSTGFAVAPIDQ